MNSDQRLRNFALEDLKRLIPPAHYWLREHAPIADRELTQPMLERPIQFGLTPREHDAANALNVQATYLIQSRAIFEIAYPAQDYDEPRLDVGMDENQEREIYGRREHYRQQALSYAITIGDTQLVEAFQPMECTTSPPIVDKARTKYTWGELEVEKLIRESKEPDMTHSKLAQKYNVTRQFISKKLKEAAPPKANAFTSFVKSGKK